MVTLRRKNMKVLILGSSAGAISCADTLRKNDSDVEITVAGKETILPYYRPQLSHMLCDGKEDKHFYLKAENYYKDKNIELLTGKEAVKIDRDSKSVEFASGENIKYDKLVLAVGSINFVPPVEGSDIPGVFDLKFYDDMENINTYIRDKKTVTIVGGGLLGIEAAWTFRKSGKNVNILEFGDRLMARQLSEKASQIILKELGKEGINVFTQKSTKCIIGSDKVEKIILNSGEEISTDMIMFSVGIRPQIGLASEAGLETDKGIVVKEDMKTSDKDIYAVGDCAQVNGVCLGIWPLAMQTGKVAAMDILGKSIEFTMNPPATILKALDIGVYSAGDVTDKDDEIEILEGENYKLYTFKNNIFTGANLIGETKLSSKIFSMLTKKTTREEFLEIMK